MAKRPAQEFFNVLPGGLIASVHSATVTALESLCQIAGALYSGGKFKGNSRPDEVRDLQAAMLEHLRAAGIDAKEGAEMGGGEADIVLPGEIVVENKVVAETSDPMGEKPEAGWQARRYSIAMNRRISFVVIAYKPQTEAALLTQPASVRIDQLEGCPEPRVIVRICIPWGYETPSRAKRPS